MLFSRVSDKRLILFSYKVAEAKNRLIEKLTICKCSSVQGRQSKRSAINYSKLICIRHVIGSSLSLEETGMHNVRASEAASHARQTCEAFKNTRGRRRHARRKYLFSHSFRCSYTLEITIGKSKNTRNEELSYTDYYVDLFECTAERNA